MNYEKILSQLPYSKPFLFIDELISVDENSATGNFTFSEDLDFYKGHFKEHPVTPGVILIECMAQIGLVCLGIYLLNQQNSENLNPQIAMTSSDVEYLKPVYPGEKVKVVSEKEYFRFSKLRCNVSMYKSNDELVCKGNLAGMILRKTE